MARPTITSRSNPLIKRLLRLRRRRDREVSGRFIVEGEREVTRAVEAGVTPELLVVAPELLTERSQSAVDRVDDLAVEVVEMGRDAFSPLSRRQNPDGILIEARWSPRRLEDLTWTGPGLVLVAEGIEKPGNLGAMLRSADAAAADAVIAADAATDLVNPNVIRASQGSVFAVPAVVCGVDAALAFLRSRRLFLVALTPDAERPLWDLDLTDGTAIVVGSEQRGLSPALGEGSTRAAIPMPGSADSLNASVAAGIGLYEASRQRRLSTA